MHTINGTLTSHETRDDKGPSDTVIIKCTHPHSDTNERGVAHVSLCLGLSPTLRRAEEESWPHDLRPARVPKEIEAGERTCDGYGYGGAEEGVAEFYDESSRVWEDIWGDHMHHGFYDPQVAAPSSIDGHRSAQFRMIEEALGFAAVQDDSENKPKTIVDVGCGIGGSSRYLAKKYGAKCVGISLSPIQVQRAQELTLAQGLADTVSFQVGDALEQPFPDGQFDLVWSMESGEHMPDKMKFVSELVRVAAPGANIIIVTWCHRNLSPDETSLQPQEEELLKKICNAFYLPKWCSAADYVKLLESMSMEDIKSADWSDYVAPFWPAVIRSALTGKGLFSLLRSVIEQPCYRMENHKGSTCNATDDQRVQEQSHQVCHYHLQEA
ncbi:hypothetical protein Sjap_004046 [Stephania japonica]|uniref:Methyltransferase type 11 domain-containing protein n=1 Tax=Stephania japonica TaxID=461633 RepID=A0AAP0PGN6_9MAGN